jgi:hypothetical protein
MKKLFVTAALTLGAHCAALAQNTTLICIWNISEGKRQSYIVDFDAAKNTVNFNGAPATDPAVTPTQVQFTLRFKDAVWTHTIARSNGLLTVTKSDAPDTRSLQCNTLNSGSF